MKRSLKIPMMDLIKSKCFLSVCECSVNVFVDSESAPPSGLAGSLALVPRAAIKMVARAYRGLPWDPLGPASPFRDPLDPQRDPLGPASPFRDPLGPASPFRDPLDSQRDPLGPASPFRDPLDPQRDPFRPC
jgi:hypothetical protein